MNEMMNEREPGVELRIQDLLMAYLRKWRLLAVCMLLAGLIAFGITYFGVTPMYRATATIYVNNNRAADNKDYLTSSDLSASIHLVKGYMILAKSDTILEKAAEKLGEGYTVAKLRNVVTVEQIDETVIFGVYVIHNDREEAARIANAVAEVIPVEGPNVIEATSARVIDKAKVPTSPYSPVYSRNIMLGITAGMLLAVVYVTIMFLKDTRIKDENDLTDMFDIPILGRIPDFDDAITGNRFTYTTDKE